MATLLLTVVAMLIIVTLIAVRILLVPNGEFHGTCSSNNPYLKRENNGNCLVCGKAADEPCPNGPDFELPESDSNPNPNNRT